MSESTSASTNAGSLEIDTKPQNMCGEEALGEVDHVSLVRDYWG